MVGRMVREMAVAVVCIVLGHNVVVRGREQMERNVLDVQPEDERHEGRQPAKFPRAEHHGGEMLPPFSFQGKRWR